MHSSRIRTARWVTVSQHALGGGVSQHALGRDVCISACTGQGGVCPDGVADTLPMNRMTDRCKNITLPQLRCGR